LLFASIFSPREIRILTKNAGLFKRIEKLSAAALPDKLAWETVSAGTGRRTIYLSGREEIKKIYEVFEYDIDTHIALHLNGWLLEEDCCRAAFLRGMFLTGGYIANPEKIYYLDISGTHAALMREIYVLLSDIGLKPKLIRRKMSHVIYFKECEQIENYLTLAGAHGCVIALMEARVIKDVRNEINRKVNCETANLFKTVETGNSQLEAISKFFASGGDRNIDQKLVEAGMLRIKYPDEPLSRLAKMTDPPVSKSGFNHRIRKLLEYTKKADDMKTDTTDGEDAAHG
jgi:DNA-binding protein WhiA